MLRPWANTWVTRDNVSWRALVLFLPPFFFFCLDFFVCSNKEVHTTFKSHRQLLCGGLPRLQEKIVSKKREKGETFLENSLQKESIRGSTDTKKKGGCVVWVKICVADRLGKKMRLSTLAQTTGRDESHACAVFFFIPPFLPFFFLLIVRRRKKTKGVKTRREWFEK